MEYAGFQALIGKPTREACSDCFADVRPVGNVRRNLIDPHEILRQSVPLVSILFCNV
jgi:hypothetical protein